jgi:hypothetical protein
MWAVKIGFGVSGAFEIQSWRQPDQVEGWKKVRVQINVAILNPPSQFHFHGLRFLDFPWFPGTIAGTVAPQQNGEY